MSSDIWGRCDITSTAFRPNDEVALSERGLFIEELTTI